MKPTFVLLKADATDAATTKSEADRLPRTDHGFSPTTRVGGNTM